MKLIKVTVGVDKKLNINYNSAGLHIGVEAEVEGGESLEQVARELKKTAEEILDPMVVESAISLPSLIAKAKK